MKREKIWFVPILFIIILSSSIPPLCAESDEATKAYLKGDYKKTVEILKKKHRKGEVGIQEGIILARSYIHLSKKRQAQDVLRFVLKSDSENPEANSLYGKLLFEDKNYHEAVQYLKKAVKLKKDPFSLSLLGRCYYELGDLTEAATKLKEALAQDIRNPANGYILGLIYLQRGYGMRSEQYLLKALSAGMQGKDILKALGKSYLLQRKYLGPVTKRHLTERANQGEILEDGIVLGEAREEKDTYYVSSKYSSIFYGYQLLNLAPDDIDALYMVCEGWLAFGNCEKVVSYLPKIRKNDASSPRAASLEARILLAMNDYKTLDKHLRRIQKKRILPEREIARYYYSSGLLLQASGKRDEAIAELKKAESLDPVSEKIVRVLAEISRTGGSIDEAIIYYTRFIELFPDANDIQETKNLLDTLKEKKE